MEENDLEILFNRLFPLNRSVLGKGYRESLGILSEFIPFRNLKFRSGTKVFDWTIPQEWKVKEAYLKGPRGEKIVNLADNNLHIINYSIPVDTILDLEDLKPHLYSIPELPKAIPYVTSYYKENWGFCMPHELLKNLPRGKYHAVIKSSFSDGFLTIGEAVLPGESEKEIQLSTYLCHPSMANNELSGPLTMVYLYSELSKQKKRKYTYRFVINPETIGSLSYLSLRWKDMKENLLGGLVLTCLGGPKEKLSYKSSKYALGALDKFFWRKHKAGLLDWRDFTPLGGSDERQYNSPSFVLPVGQMARTVYEEHPEYHNSLDNKEFMGITQVLKSAQQLLAFLREFEQEDLFLPVSGYGEPFLGKHNLYPSINSSFTRRKSSGDLVVDGKRQQRTVMYLLSYSDGTNTLEEIALKLGEEPDYIKEIAFILTEKKLLKKI